MVSIMIRTSNNIEEPAAMPTRSFLAAPAGDLQKCVRGAAGQDRRRRGVGVARQLGDVVGGLRSITGAGELSRSGLKREPHLAF